MFEFVLLLRTTRSLYLAKQKIWRSPFEGLPVTLGGLTGKWNIPKGGGTIWLCITGSLYIKNKNRLSGLTWRAMRDFALCMQCYMVKKKIAGHHLMAPATLSGLTSWLDILMQVEGTILLEKTVCNSRQAIATQPHLLSRAVKFRMRSRSHREQIHQSNVIYIFYHLLSYL